MSCHAFASLLESRPGLLVGAIAPAAPADNFIIEERY